MDEVLKKVAKLDNHELTIYTSTTENAQKPGKKERKPRIYNRKPKPSDYTFSESDEFDFDKYAQEFPTVCEADVAFAKLDSEAKSLVVKRIKTQEQQGKAQWSVCIIINIPYVELKSLGRTRSQEAFCRSDRCAENESRPKYEKLTSLFHSETLLSIFAANLQAQKNADIDAKLQELGPFITFKSFPALHEAVKDHMHQVIASTDVLLTEMQSIWSRARRQPSLHDLVSDFKRIRRLKASQPSLDLAGLLDAFACKENKKREEFLDRKDVHVEVVNEAVKRIGADTFGPSKAFASILDEIVIEEETDQDAVSSEDIIKLQKAIKKALNSSSKQTKEALKE